MAAYLVIIGTNDNPLYELNCLVQNTSSELHLLQFIAFASLDHLSSLKPTAMYLKNIDKFNEFYVSAYVCYTGNLFLYLNKKKV
jgi:hypothetical protein